MVDFDSPGWEEDAEMMLQWSEMLDYDAYVADWASLGTSAPSDLPLRLRVQANGNGIDISSGIGSTTFEFPSDEFEVEVRSAFDTNRGWSRSAREESLGPGTAPAASVGEQPDLLQKVNLAPSAVASSHL